MAQRVVDKKFFPLNLDANLKLSANPFPMILPSENL